MSALVREQNRKDKQRNNNNNRKKIVGGILRWQQADEREKHVHKNKIPNTIAQTMK